jgi:hypothetical protein
MKYRNKKRVKRKSIFRIAMVINPSLYPAWACLRQAGQAGPPAKGGKDKLEVLTSWEKNFLRLLSILFKRKFQ